MHILKVKCKWGCINLSAFPFNFLYCIPKSGTPKIMSALRSEKCKPYEWGTYTVLDLHLTRTYQSNE